MENGMHKNGSVRCHVINPLRVADITTYAAIKGVMRLRRWKQKRKFTPNQPGFVVTEFDDP